METEWIYSFAERSQDKTVIVDESFIEFSGQVSIISLLEQNPLQNVIVIKSLSKSLGVPGIRLGYVYSCDIQFNAYIKENIPIWNMNSMAEFFLEIILKHRNAFHQSIKSTIEDRTSFSANLSNVSFIDKVYKSAANFILVKLKEDSEFAKLLTCNLISEKEIYIKDVSAKFSDGSGYLRFAVRLPDENMKLIDCLRDFGDKSQSQPVHMLEEIQK
jgi:histidinol-phosphate/aromatic aminotransferase/cobyric acid decarboxylase-like protein